MATLFGDDLWRMRLSQLRLGGMERNMRRGQPGKHVAILHSIIIVLTASSSQIWIFLVTLFGALDPSDLDLGRLVPLATSH